IAVEIDAREVLDRDAAVVDDLSRPLRSDVVQRLIDADATAMFAAVVADADDQLIGAVAVEVGRRDAVAPFQLVVDHVPGPKGAGRRRLGVDDDLMAMPRFDGGDESLAAFEFPLLDLTGAAVRLRVVLVADAEMSARPLAVRGFEQADPLVAGGQDRLA